MGCKMRPSIDEMVTEVLEWFKQSSDEERKSFIGCDVDDLVVWYHKTLGQDIRNHFKLWDYEWEKVLVDGIDYSPTHPDNLSGMVIKEVHKKLNKT